MRCPERHPRRTPRLQRLLPARRAEAPAIPRLEPGKAELAARGRQIVALRAAERQELRCHHRADRVAAEVFRPGIAAAIPKEAGHRRAGARFQQSPEHIPRPTGPATLAWGIEWHGLTSFRL